MKAGRLLLTAHSVQLQHLEAEADRQQQPSPKLSLIAEVGGFGRLKTGERAAERGGEGSGVWVCSLENQELSFDLGPSPGVLKVVVYEAREGQRDSFVAEGSLNMEHIGESGKQEGVQVPLVGDDGRHRGDATLSARFFHSRTPGKGRDELGRDVMDAEILSRGPCEGPKQLNERSPNSPRSGSPVGSPRLKANRGPHQPA